METKDEQKRIDDPQSIKKKTSLLARASEEGRNHEPIKGIEHFLVSTGRTPWGMVGDPGGELGSFHRPQLESSDQRGPVRMQAVAVARAVLLAALALFLIGDLTSLALRIAGASGADKELGHHANSIPQNDRLARLTSAVKNSCLPKLICELNASQEKDKLTPKAKSLLQLIRDTSISMTADSSSRYHFAAHMGQLIAGIDGTGCHNFYPSCPLPSVRVLSLLNKPSLV